jgi:hypothetical protein
MFIVTWRSASSRPIPAEIMGKAGLRSRFIELCKLRARAGLDPTLPPSVACLASCNAPARYTTRTSTCRHLPNWRRSRDRLVSPVALRVCDRRRQYARCAGLCAPICQRSAKLAIQTWPYDEITDIDAFQELGQALARAAQAYPDAGYAATLGRPAASQSALDQLRLGLASGLTESQTHE